MFLPFNPGRTSPLFSIVDRRNMAALVLGIHLIWFCPLAVHANQATLAEELYRKGVEYYRAQDMPQHYDEAFVWLSKAAEYQHSHARALVADMYSHGLGTPIHVRESLKFAMEAARQGDTFGQFLFAKALYQGLGIEQDQEEGVTILSRIFSSLESAAELGDMHAQYSLAWIYANLSTTSPDHRKAHYWYEKSALQGYAVAQNDLGLMFGRGLGVRKNSKAEIVWYRRAASQGFPLAQFNLGLALGEQGDVAGKFTWIRRAAHLHYADAEFVLGQIYEEGEGGPPNLDEALAWYRRAAAQHHPAALYRLGLFYEDGRGVPQDYKIARGWYEQAAKQGYAEALAKLGLFAEQGLGVPQNFQEAQGWYEKAAKLGSASSQTHLGFFYLQGNGVAQDLELARKWFTLAAQGGNNQALYGIGLIQEQQKKYWQAIRWYLLSALKGYGLGLKRAVYLLVLSPAMTFLA